LAGRRTSYRARDKAAAAGGGAVALANNTIGAASTGLGAFIGILKEAGEVRRSVPAPWHQPANVLPPTSSERGSAAGGLGIAPDRLLESTETVQCEGRTGHAAGAQAERDQ